MFKNDSAERVSASRGLWVALGLCVSIPMLVWWHSVGDLRVYIDYQTPPGQIFYVLSKLVGMYALFVAWLQILFVLLKQSVPESIGRWWSLGFHRVFGLTVLGCVMLHAVLFIAAVSLRKEHVAFGLLLPNFEGFYSTAVTLGLVGVYGIIVVAIAGFMRAVGWSRAAWVHYLAIPVFVCAYLHSLLIGTETRSIAMLVLYIFMGTTLLGVGLYRLRRHRAVKNKSKTSTFF